MPGLAPPGALCDAAAGVDNRALRDPGFEPRPDVGAGGMGEPPDRDSKAAGEDIDHGGSPSLRLLRPLGALRRSQGHTRNGRPSQISHSRMAPRDGYTPPAERAHSQCCSSSSHDQPPTQNSSAGPPGRTLRSWRAASCWPLELRCAARLTCVVSLTPVGTGVSVHRLL